MRRACQGSHAKELAGRAKDREFLRLFAAQLSQPGQEAQQSASFPALSIAHGVYTL